MANFRGERDPVMFSDRAYNVYNYAPDTALQMPLQRHNEIDQPLGIDPPGAHVFLEPFHLVHSQFIPQPPTSCSASFREWTATRQHYGLRDQEFFRLKIYALHRTKYALVG